MAFSQIKYDTDYTKQIVSWVKNLKYEDIPPMVVDRVKMFMIHCCGVSLCAKDIEGMQKAIEIAKEISPGKEGGATLWGDGAKVSPEAALFAASAMADCLDWEDCAITGHPTAGVIPTAVIMGEVLHKSGKEVLTAAVAAYEAYLRISLAGRSGISSYNIFGNLTLLMKLMDLDEEKMNQLYGIGCTMASTPANVHELTMSDSLNFIYGLRGNECVTALRIVMSGIENLEDGFDIPYVYYNHCAYYKPEILTMDLGNRWMLMDSLLMKHHPGNMFVQTYEEIAHRLLAKYHFNTDDIEEVIVRPSIAFRNWYTKTGYKSITQAQFSLPYTIAVALTCEEPGANWYSDETMSDPKIIELLNKVKADGFVDVKGLDVLKDLMDGKHPEKHIIVRMKDGTEYEDSLFTHPGHPNYMLTREEVVDRFKLETKYVLAPETADKFIETALKYDQLDDAAELPKYIY